MVLLKQKTSNKIIRKWIFWGCDGTYGCFINITYGLTEPVASSLINAITGIGVRRTGKIQEGGVLPLLTLPLAMKVDRRGYNKKII